MPRYKLGVRYDGRLHHGFQSQNNATTIEGDIEKALATYFRQTIDITGSSRTDRGVHALENTAHFDFDGQITDKDIYHLNSILSPSISILYIKEVSSQFHARFDARYRSYSYFIHSYKDPLVLGRSYYFPYKLQLDKLTDLASEIPNYKDFSSFSKQNSDVHHYECDILESRWEVEDHRLSYHVSANRFLRGMVRALVASQLAVARDYWRVEDFMNRLHHPEISTALFSSPAEGLFLDTVGYTDYEASS